MEAMDYMSILLRWLHIGAGVLWIGLLYFFNFVVKHQLKREYEKDEEILQYQKRILVLWADCLKRLFDWVI